MKVYKIIKIAGLLGMTGMLQVASATIIDTLVLGDPTSEQAHALEAISSEIIEGSLGSPARRFLPRDDHRWRGGNATFQMAVDSEQVNYCTVKLWGGDYSKDAVRMMLFIDGKQVGQRHLGEKDQLDISGEYPRFEGGFYYHTFPLPLTETNGKQKVDLAIELQGGIWAYGPSFERFQRDLKENSRGIYRMYTHTESFFVPSADDPQGAPKAPPLRDNSGEEVIQQVKDRINKTLVDLMNKKDDRFSQEEMAFMARAYHEPWTKAYRSQQIVKRIVGGIDHQYLRYLGEVDEFNWKSDWFGFGYTGDAVRYLKSELRSYLNERITGKNITRKEGWADMFVDSRDEHVINRRSYTNQSMIWDMYGIYFCNRAVDVVDSSRAWPEREAMQFMYESMGLEPWSGSRLSKNGEPNYRLGKEYMQLTEAGLTKELGYVGAYGEVTDLVTKMYEATRPSYGAEGDQRLKKQVVKITRARAPFRYPSSDHDGYKAMRMEAVIGWRDFKYPGYVAYDQAVSRESIPFHAAAATLDPVLVGYAQQLLDDNQYFEQVAGVMKNRGLKTTVALFDVPHTYETILAQADQPNRLPMADGQPDFVFSDPGNGVLALKNGDDILYASLYWRARYAINNLARIHHITPQIERSATVWQQTEFTDSGSKFYMKDQVNAPFSSKFERDYQDGGLGGALAEAGVELSIAEVPMTYTEYEAGKENIAAGKGNFYRLEYGNYYIAMNCTEDQTYDLSIPKAFVGATDLVSGYSANVTSCKVKPRQTLVLYRLQK